VHLTKHRRYYKEYHTKLL